MSLLIIVGMALGLAMDAFAVAIAAGIMLPVITLRHYFRLCFHFGLFQALMPMIGWMAGRTIAEYIEVWDHWVALGLLSLIGLKMIHESYKDDNEKSVVDPTKGLRLVSLSIATSMDALAVGFSLAILGVEIVYPSIVIGVITMSLTFVGMILGRALGAVFGKWTERIGGMILILIGVKIVIEHLG